MARLPPFKSIEAFVVAAQSLSFTTTASVLHITVPAVSRRIQALEVELGISLFQREHRSLELTEAGREYAQRLTPAIEAIRVACEGVRVAPRKSSLRISVRPAFAISWLFPRLHRFAERHGNIGLEFETSTQELDAVSDNFDIAIRLGDGQWSSLEATPLMNVAMFPVSSMQYAYKHLHARSPVDILSGKLLCCRHLDGIWSSWAEAFGIVEHDDDARESTLFLHDLSLVYEAATNGLGIAPGFDVLIDPYIRNGKLIRLTERPFIPDCKFYALVRPKDRDRIQVQTFIHWLLDEARALNRDSIAFELTDLSQNSIVASPSAR
ncbi:LysR substrate-binding domain-containing protein [Burkholderia sp. TSV86]|uniref:LysR substrate-binding domain-containing protein n=1 Tax=Burkholderia sp. TSV86 TaxID=1385594 RepID=UPI00075845F8|nr:LysR substrate-binding domain-containing protein [Burkholderia sp. TSV86]KVE37918.1 hypothetical protein WS68_25390 [Burkholderia sp. TSV86]